MWVYAVVFIGFIVLLAALEGVRRLLCGTEDLKRIKDANSHLIAQKRKLEAQNRKLIEDNRRLIGKLSHAQAQADSRWEEKYDQVQMCCAEQQDRVKELERELKIKDTMLKKLEGKVAV